MKLALVTLALVAALAAQPVAMHEWGTFSAVAGPDGKLVPSATGRTLDLPCFVNRLPPGATNSAAATRLQGVLSFYASHAAALNVRLDLPQAWITAAYPRSISLFPDGSGWPAYPRGDAVYREGRIEWNELEVLPGAEVSLHPNDTRKPMQHYYASRRTDAAPVRLRRQAEKMIFYRGLGIFETALQARTADGRFELRNTSESPIGVAFVIEYREGRMGYRVVRDLRGEEVVAAPDLSASAAELAAIMQRELQAAGLFEKEAAAMLVAWSDAWFTAGTRVLYLVPRAEIDKLLPLTIAPAPVAVTRVYVGHVEMFNQTPPEPVRERVPVRQSTDPFTVCDPTPK